MGRHSSITRNLGNGQRGLSMMPGKESKPTAADAISKRPKRHICMGKDLLTSKLQSCCQVSRSLNQRGFGTEEGVAYRPVSGNFSDNPVRLRGWGRNLFNLRAQRLSVFSLSPCKLAPCGGTGEQSHATPGGVRCSRANEAQNIEKRDKRKPASAVISKAPLREQATRLPMALDVRRSNRGRNPLKPLWLGMSISPDLGSRRLPFVVVNRARCPCIDTTLTRHYTAIHTVCFRDLSRLQP